MKLWQRIKEIDYDYRPHTQIMIIDMTVYLIGGDLHKSYCNGFSRHNSLRAVLKSLYC